MKRANKGSAAYGIYTLDDLRARCVIDPDPTEVAGLEGHCWHLRRADGSRYEIAQDQRVWIGAWGRAACPTQAAFKLANPDREIGPGLVVYRACAGHDCVNPDHLRVGRRKTATRASRQRGSLNTPARVAMVAALSEMKRRAAAPKELRQWVIESPLGSAEAAAETGLSRSMVLRIRQEHRREQERRAALVASSSIFRAAGMLDPSSE